MYHDDFGHEEPHAPVFHSSDEGHHLSDHLGLYDMGFAPNDIYQRPSPLKDRAGQVTLIVNVASQCGYTQSNYIALQQLYDKYKAQGFQIMAFPSSDFGNQEPNGDAEIASYVQARFHVGFQMMSKLSNINDHPLFTWLRAHAPAIENDPDARPGADLSWNFQKFLVDKWGRPMRRYDSADHKEQLDHDIGLAIQMPWDPHAFDDVHTR